MTSDTNNLSNDTIVSFQDATLRIRQRFILADTDWTVKRNQHWAILGPNGAGKTTLVRALTGQVPVVRGTIWPADIGSDRHRIAYVSFDQHRHLLAKEDRLDAARWYSGHIHDETIVEDYLIDGLPAEVGKADLAETLSRLQAGDLIHQGIRHLSTGEMRKVLIARAILRNPAILILDEPYNGLDSESALRLFSLIDHLTAGPMSIILVTHRLEEIPPRTTHMLGVKDGRIIFRGPKEKMMRGGRIHALYSSSAVPTPGVKTGDIEAAGSKFNGVPTEPLVEMRGATIKYKRKPVIRRIDWTILAGQNWAIVGPNGSGKTTLLNLIYGDHPQVYANRVYMFGRRRGRGESVWEIKERIGMVSTEIQLRYRKPVTALEAVISGFFDAIGLYRRPTREQSQIALQWMQVIGIESLAARRFEWLSTGQQRLVLIARAMVKSPRMLLLDEPTQGLDPANREGIMTAVDAICRDPAVSVIFVSHRPEDLPGSITRLLTLVPSSSGSDGRISTR